MAAYGCVASSRSRGTLARCVSGGAYWCGRWSRFGRNPVHAGGDERQGLMRMPATPGTHLVVRQARFTLGTPQALLDAMLRLEDTGKLRHRQRSLRSCNSQRNRSNGRSRRPRRPRYAAATDRSRPAWPTPIRAASGSARPGARPLPSAASGRGPTTPAGTSAPGSFRSCRAGHTTAARSPSSGHAPFAPSPASRPQTARGSSPAAVAHLETRVGPRRRPSASLPGVRRNVVPSLTPLRGLVPRKDWHLNALHRARPRGTVELEVLYNVS
jgi:hypothetical protein